MKQHLYTILICAAIISCDSSKKPTNSNVNSSGEKVYQFGVKDGEHKIGKYLVVSDGEEFLVTGKDFNAMISITNDGNVMVSSGNQIISIDFDENGYKAMRFITTPNTEGKGEGSMLMDSNGSDGFWDTKTEAGGNYDVNWSFNHRP